MKIFLKAIVVPFIFILSSSAFASNWYKVEVVIFANNDLETLNDEYWPDINEIPLLDRAIALKPRTGDSPSAYQSLPTSRHGLKSVRSRLNNSGDYRVIFHEAWMQPVSRTQNPRPIKISAGRILDNGMHELEGHIAVGRGRYLHFRPDIYLSQLVSPNTATTTVENSEESKTAAMLTMQGENKAEPQNVAAGPAFPTIPEILTVKLDQARRMKSKELHYIDHPLMGILVEIKPLK